MSKEQFLYNETKPVFDLIEEASQRSGVSRGQAFEDFLHMSVCAMSGGTMEDQYLAVVERHKHGKPGRRGCDSIARAFGTLVASMEQTQGEMIDVLGDLFQGAITYGEAGQFMTPQPVCRAMARLTIGEDTAEESDEGSPASSSAESVESASAEEPTTEPPVNPKPIPRTPKRTVCDPACGSGRMLLAVAEIHPHWEFHGQDVDLRCVRLTALNLAFRNLYGYVTWGNSLGLEKKLIYRTGFDLRGFIREIKLEECPAPVRLASIQPPVTSISPFSDDSNPAPHADGPAKPGKQLRLF